MTSRLYAAFPCAALLAAALLSGCAVVADAPAPDSVARWNPQTWVSNITPADVSANYPRAAFAAGIGGVVLVQCRVTQDGAFTDCAVVEETPPGHGFGEAALRMVPIMKLRTDGPAFRPGAVMRFPVTFQVG